MPQPQDADLYHAWVAGFFDGEGHLGLYKVGGSHIKSPLITISNRNSEALEIIQEVFGGSLREGDPDMYGISCKTLRLSAGQVVSFLEVIGDYLVVKKKAAQLVLEYQSRRRRPGRDGYFVEELEWFRWADDTLWKLNKGLPVEDFDFEPKII